MSGSVSELRAMYGRWLQLRVKLRALALGFAASEYALRRDGRSGDAETAALVARLAAERRAFTGLEGELDARIGHVKRELDEIERAWRGALIAAARSSSRHC